MKSEQDDDRTTSIRIQVPQNLKADYDLLLALTSQSISDHLRAYIDAQVSENRDLLDSVRTLRQRHQQQKK